MTSVLTPISSFLNLIGENDVVLFANADVVATSCDCGTKLDEDGYCPVCDFEESETDVFGLNPDSDEDLSCATCGTGIDSDGTCPLGCVGIRDEAYYDGDDEDDLDEDDIYLVGATEYEYDCD